MNHRRRTLTYKAAILAVALYGSGCSGKAGGEASPDAAADSGSLAMGDGGGGSSSSSSASSSGGSASGSGSGGSSGDSSGGGSTSSGSGSSGGTDAGTIACGSYSCNAATEFCYEAGGGAVLPDASSNFVYACNPIPAQCEPNPTCACIIAADAGTHGCPCGVQPGGGLLAACLYP